MEETHEPPSVGVSGTGFNYKPPHREGRDGWREREKVRTCIEGHETRISERLEGGLL